MSDRKLTRNSVGWVESSRPTNSTRAVVGLDDSTHPTIWFGVFLCLSGCVQDMANQPRFEAYEASAFFKDGMAMRTPVEGTIARGELPDDPVVVSGKRDDQLVEHSPLPLTRELFERGRERFGIFCAHCHGLVGDGNGMVVKRGFPAPPTYHSERLRSVPDGHLFQVISDGFGRMPAFRARIAPRDRWALVAWLRVLQFSQHATASDLPESDRMQLEAQQP